MGCVLSGIGEAMNKPFNLAFLVDSTEGSDFLCFFISDFLCHYFVRGYPWMDAREYLS